MGEYATLGYGHFTVASFKNHIPFHALLMFEQEDMIVSNKPSHDYPWPTYRFVTTARQAIQRLDNRGLDLSSCKEIWDDLRSTEIYLHTGPGFEHEDFRWVANPMDFDRYLATLRRIFENKKLALPLTWGALQSFEDDLDAQLLAHMFSNGELLDSEAEYYFFDLVYCVLFCAFLEVIPLDAPIVLDVSDLVNGGRIEESEVATLFPYYMKLMQRRIELDYRIYGFVLLDDPKVNNMLRERVMALDEDRFILHVLQPLLRRMGYEHVRIVEYHGSGEFGKDILPFQYTTPLGTAEYYAVQAKATRIHGASKREGNAGELISQVVQAFSITFVDDYDNERKRIDKFVIATNKTITPAARTCIGESIEGNRGVVFLDIDRIIELVRQHGLVQYLLFSDLP